MNKKYIRDAFLELFQEKIDVMNDSVDGSKRQAWDSPGANVSHSDTNKFNLSNLALGQSSVISGYQEAKLKLQSLVVDDLETVILGSIFQIFQPDTEDKKTYYLVPAGGGETIEYEGVEINTISVGAPLVQHAIGKEEGEEFTFKGKKYEILRIW